MSQSRSHIERANEILAVMKAAKIYSDSKNMGKKFRLIREMSLDIARSSGNIAPGITSCVATTLLNLGLCQEVSQRFVLEYVLKFKEKNINLIIIGNPAVGYTPKDHVFVYIGHVKAPEELFIGHQTVGNSPTLSEASQSLSDFFAANKDGAFADPLLQCAGLTDKDLAPLHDYCKNYNITHVISIRSFENTPLLVENAPTIMQNAVQVAEKVNKALNPFANLLNNTPTQTKADENRKPQLKSGFFNTKQDNRIEYGKAYRSIAISDVDKKEVSAFRK